MPRYPPGVSTAWRARATRTLRDKRRVSRTRALEVPMPRRPRRPRQQRHRRVPSAPRGGTRVRRVSRTSSFAIRVPLEGMRRKTVAQTPLIVWDAPRARKGRPVGRRASLQGVPTAWPARSTRTPLDKCRVSRTRAPKEPMPRRRPRRPRQPSLQNATNAPPGATAVREV